MKYPYVEGNWYPTMFKETEDMGECSLCALLYLVSDVDGI